MKALYDQMSRKHSMSVTQMYSTSFSSGVSLLGPSLRDPIHAIYGFVRLADEIVDSFHDYDQAHLLQKFKADTFEAIEIGISLNPILNSFQDVVNRYNIDKQHIVQFLQSMEMDLDHVLYNKALYEDYILGSAQVVGLMCLHVFCEGDTAKYNQLAPYAKSLGSAFQKVNFLRDIKADVEHLGRLYFPNVEFGNFNDEVKREIEREIDLEFNHALVGIKMLPRSSKLGVYAAYAFYKGLLRQIMKANAAELFTRRIRVSNFKKLSLMMQSRTLVTIGQV